MKRNPLFCLLLTLSILLAYSNSFENTFQYDDSHVIERNPFIKAPGKIPELFLDPQKGSGIYNETSSYRPLLMASFALNYSLGGLQVFGYHLGNLFLHLLCAGLVYFITLHFFRLLDGQEDLSLRHQLTACFAALAFGLHPVQTESVTYISGRSSTLAAVFFLASFFLYLQYSLTPRTRDLVGSSFAYACALLVKETAITLPAILILFSLLFLRDRPVKSRCLSLLPYILLSGLYLFFRVYFFGSLQYGSQPVRPLYDQLLSQPRAWVHYLGTLLLPLNLNIDYDLPTSHSLLEPQVVLSIILLGAVSGVIWRLSRSHRSAGFWALWFAVTLLPTNSVIALEDLVCDRWLYLPSVGFAVLLALGLDGIFQRQVKGKSRAAKIIFFFLGALVLELYGFGTMLRNVDWTNQRTLWEDTVAKSPGKSRPYNGLGLALVLQDRLEEAKRNFEHAITLDPRGGQPYLNLAYVYRVQGKWDRAVEFYEKSLPLNPKLGAEIYNQLGFIYLSQEKWEASEEVLRRSIAMRPHNPAPYHNLGLYFEKRGNIDQAISYQEKANQLDPDYSLPYEALGRLYQQKGWKAKSLEAYQNYLKYSSRS